ncbi:MAG: insulinase family protein [Ktedonobacterales bacterium]|nr:insulinase family protein [Ktedonobacterales bacterium]
MYERVTLPNGIRLLTERVMHVRSASVLCYFGVGSRYEHDAVAGIAHLIEHMLFKGSARYPTAQRISETIESVGGVLDAETGKESTIYSVKVVSRHFDLAMDLLADMLRRPRFERAELERERRVILEELGMYHDSPQDWVSVLAEEAFWPGMPLGREVVGTRESVAAMPLEALTAFYAAHYVPGNLVVSIVSDLPHERVAETVERLLGDWAPAAVPSWTPCPPPSGPPRIQLERRKTEQSNLLLLTLGLARTDPDHYPLVLLNTILGDSMSSRLFMEVREKRGLAYDVGSSAIGYHETGTFGVSAGVEPARLPEALGAILGELRRMRETPVSAEELTRAREYTKGRLALGLEDTFSVASWLGGQEALLGKIEEVDEVLAKLDAVTVEDIQRTAERLFRDEWLRLAVIGPHRSADDLRKLLTF